MLNNVNEIVRVTMFKKRNLIRSVVVYKLDYHGAGLGKLNHGIALALLCKLMIGFKIKTEPHI